MPTTTTAIDDLEPEVEGFGYEGWLIAVTQANADNANAQATAAAQAQRDRLQNQQALRYWNCLLATRMSSYGGYYIRYR